MSLNALLQRGMAVLQVWDNEEIVVAGVTVPATIEAIGSDSVGHITGKVSMYRLLVLKSNYAGVFKQQQVIQVYGERMSVSSYNQDAISWTVTVCS